MVVNSTSYEVGKQYTSPCSNDVATPACSGKKENARTSNEHAMQAHRKQQKQRQSSGREFKSSHLALPHLQQDSNSYSNDDDIQHSLAIHSEQQGQEMSP